MILLQLVILALVLWVLLRLGWRAIHLIEPGNRFRRLLLRYFPLLEFGLWLWLVFRFAEAVFSDLAYYEVVMGIMAVALIAALGWYLLRDFLSGIIMKTEIAFEKGQYIKTEIASGKISKLGYRCIILETDEGEKIRIPYSRLNNQLLSLPAGEDASHSHVIELLVERNRQAGELQREISTRLFNMPWVITGFAPQVNISIHDERHFLAEVRFNVIRREHVILVEESLRSLSAGPEPGQ